MTLVVTPWANLDPINLPKLLILGISGFAAMGNLAPYVMQMAGSDARLLTYAIFFFLTALVLVFFASDADKWAQIYGAYGRNTGLLAYIGLALILLAVVFVSNASFVRKLLWVLICSGAINSTYGILQWTGTDVFKWEGPPSWIIGTLGNPNFLSALLGISAAASLALSLERNCGIWLRLMLNFLIVFASFVMYLSKSSQGLLIFSLAVTLIIYFRFITALHRAIRSGYWLLIAGLLILGVFGVLNRGPFASFLYQVSVTYRGDYWRAGWKMTMEHPLFGVGLDSYGDWYRFFRAEAAALRRGPDVTSNSAHNVFLDISSNGGLLLLVAYLVIIGLIVRSGLRVLRTSQGFDALGVGLVSAWLAYIIQSVISINQLGLAIWGWVLGGAIIGYDLYKDRPSAPRVSGKKSRRPEQVPAVVVLTGSLGLVVGLVLSVWPFAKDMSFKTALESGDAKRIENVVTAFPRTSYHAIFAAGVFQDNKQVEEALNLARLAIETNPRDFNAWKMLVANPKLSDEERAAAVAKMKELDPYNNTLDK